MWLISERKTACDNGFALFQYIRKKHPEINAYYVVDRSNSVAWKKVQKYGHAIPFGSKRHKLLYIFADKVISSHTRYCEPWNYQNIQTVKKFLPCWKKHQKDIYLKHGIIKDDMRMYYAAERFPVDLFVCGSIQEYKDIKGKYRHPEGVVQFLGLARFDKLYQHSEKNNILLAPTWRDGYDANVYEDVPANIEEFKKTDYYIRYQSLLDNKDLIHLLEQKQYKLIFYPHFNTQGYVSAFRTKSPNIQVMTAMDKANIAELLRDTKALITDYSSVAMDIGYINKPVIYYQFDSKVFFQTHYPEGYFDYKRDGFGIVTDSEEEVIMSVKKMFENNFVNEEKYKKRGDVFWGRRDHNNCKRIVAAIKNL